MWGWAQTQFTTFNWSLKDGENQGTSVVCSSVTPPVPSVLLATCNPIQPPIVREHVAENDDVLPQQVIYYSYRTNVFLSQMRDLTLSDKILGYLWSPDMIPVFASLPGRLLLMLENFSLLVEEAFMGSILFTFRHVGASWGAVTPDIFRYRFITSLIQKCSLTFWLPWG